MIEGLIFLLVILGVITVIGHVIWLVVAALLRALFGAGEKPTIFLPVGCAGCGVSVRATDEYCAHCGRPQRTPAAAHPLADLATTARQLDLFLNQGKLDVQTRARVMAVIEDERARLTGAAPPVINEDLPQSIGQPSAPAVAAPSEAIPSPIATVVVARAELQPEPRQSLSEMLATFMEERSIQWGELVGGLLIIGCSIALVVSLWAQIAAVPLLKFSVFVGMTAGLFGLGFYSAHRWKLPTTSRGVLIISTLLVPLDFLAMTAFSQQIASSSLPLLGSELLALALFALLVYQAAHVIAPRRAWLLVTATLGPSVAMLLARHRTDTTSSILLLGVAPMACYWGSTGALLRGLPSREEFDENEINRAFTLFGVAAFAALLPLGLLFVKTVNWPQAMHRFAWLISLFGVPAIIAGLAVWRRTNEAALSDERAGTTQTIATSLALIGGLMAVTGLLLAWPDAPRLIVVALLNGAVCLLAAWRFGLPWAHAGAVAHLVLAYLVGCNLLTGNIAAWSEDGARLARSFFSMTSGVALLPLFVLLAVVAELWRRAQRKLETTIYAVAAVAAGALSLMLATRHGFGRVGDPQRVALIYAFYAAAAFVIAWRREVRAASWLGAGLALLAVVQAMVFGYGYALAPYHPLRLSLLVYASAMTAAALVLQRRSEKARRIFVAPLAGAALLSSLIVAPLILVGDWMTTGQMATRLLWLAGIWLALACAHGWPLLFTAFQAALALSVGCGVTALIAGDVLLSSVDWVDPLLLQAQGTALVLLSLAWIGLRLSLHRWEGGQYRDREGAEGVRYRDREGADAFASDASADPAPSRSRYRTAARLFYPPWPTVDQIVVALAVAVLLALSVAGAHVGLIEELQPGRALSPGHRDYAMKALGAGSWVLLLGLGCALVAGWWERFRKRAALAMVLLLACACLLLAGRWRALGATASAYRWLSACGFALVALPIIFRRQVAQVCAQFGWPQMNERAAGLAGATRALSLVLFASTALVVTMLLFWSIAPTISLSLAAKLIFLVPVFLLSLTLAAHAIRERMERYAYAAVLLLNLAVTLAYQFNYDAPLFDLIALNVVVMAGYALAWLWLVAWRWPSTTPRRPFHQGAALLALTALATSFALQWLLKLAPANQFSEQAGLGWLAVGMVAVLLIACGRKGEGDFAWRGLYFVGLIAIGRTLFALHLTGRDLLVSSVIAVSVYACLTSWLWRNRARWQQWTERWDVSSPDAVTGSAQAWLAAANRFTTAFVALSNLIIVFSVDSSAQRLAATGFAFALPLAFTLLAASERDQGLITTGIRVAVLNAVLWGWAWLNPRAGGQVSKRLVVVMIIAAGIVIAYRLLIVRHLRAKSLWRQRLRAELPWIAVMGLTTLGCVLCAELSNYVEWGAALMAWPVVAAVLMTLLGLILASLAFALLPGEDPFAFDERQKMYYVYAAEGFVVLTLLHLRLTMPWLFTGFFTRYWPLIVMAVAFAGVGLSELFRRQGRLVLAEPLEKTGALLPLLPVFGFWLTWPPISYSGLLLLVGLFYGVLSVMRRSFAFGLLAALAGNSGLWNFLSGVDGYGFFEHPQLWLIPAALSVLLAAQINRARLNADQMATIRYAALIVIYVSSTADIFINGVIEAPWLPVVLAVLAVGGVIIGLLLRIRAFLFLGTAFLLLALLTMIWSASVNLGWEWLWYVSGIAFGVLIIYTFALFERKRAELLSLVERLKQWQ